MSMTPEQRKLARHTLGLDNPDAKGRSYRNRYYASPGHSAWADLHIMVGNGWMNLEDVQGGVGTVFWLNRSGAELALDPGESLDSEDFPRAA
jgi:hypothetical protein